MVKRKLLVLFWMFFIIVSAWAFDHEVPYVPEINPLVVKKIRQWQDIRIDELVIQARIKQPDLIVVDRAVYSKNQNYLTPEGECQQGAYNLLEEYADWMRVNSEGILFLFMQEAGEDHASSNYY
jgi:hypothetical protein